MKTDATPGRINRINTFIQREGVFYGQCSELCGTLHGFMPIVIEACVTNCPEEADCDGEQSWESCLGTEYGEPRENPKFPELD